jgi:Co/Zn/Cd efflux system component
MKHCCEDKAEALGQLKQRQASVLKVLLAANAAMFVLEAGAGIAGRSTALLGDSLDMLGDALVYGATLHVLGRGLGSKAKAVLLKGGVLLLFGALVLAEAVGKLVSGAEPRAELIGSVGALALAVNTGCLLLLLRYRQQDINMRSAYICSRNDIIANLAVLGAGGLVAYFGTAWPDIVVGVGIAALFVVSAVSILRAGIEALRSEAPAG